MPTLVIADSQMTTELSVSEKIVGLSSVWMEVRRNFPYRDRLKNLDADYLHAINAVSATTDVKSYYRELQIFLAKLQDGHTFVTLPKGIFMTKSRPSLGVTRISNDAVVTWVRSDLATEIPLGSIVQAVDGMSYDAAAETASQTVFASTPAIRKDKAYILAMEGEKNSNVTLQILTPQTETRTVRLVRGQAWPEDATILSLDKDVKETVSFKWMNENRIAYMAINSFSDGTVYEKFLKHVPALKLAEYIVIDLRKNEGGNDAVGFKIISHFLKRAAKGNASVKFIYDPERITSKDSTVDEVARWPTNIGMKRIDIPPAIIKPSQPSARLYGKLIILTGHETVSAAEDFLVVASSIKHIRIGEHTAGSTGQPVVVQLPGGGAAHILSKRDSFPTGVEFIGIGIKPNIEVRPTIEDVRTGHDRVIERLLELIHQGQI